MTSDGLKRDAMAIYDAALAGVEPGRATARALGNLVPAPRVWLLAVGKAAPAMLDAALEHLTRLNQAPAGGLLVAPVDGQPPDFRVERVTGDHPLPGTGSARAAAAIVDLARRVDSRDEVWVLLSGGASSLIAAPIPEIPDSDFQALQTSLFGAGLAIDQLNRVRKRFARLAGGRLLTLLAANRIRVFVLSDVPSDDPVDVGSGPLEPDASTAAEVARILEQAVPADRVPASVVQYLTRVSQGSLPETPKPGDPAFDRRSTTIIGSNRVALEHARRAARALGYSLAPAGRLDGDANAAGRAIAELITAATVRTPTAWLLGGETTVTLAPEAGRGGRCQELSLAAAGRLAERTASDRVVLLAAGTDGRDGPTDAAGALVDSLTWARIRASGIDPEGALARHDAYPALDAANALFRPGPTGTNVMDVAIALRRP